jgi:hypothetical protein
MNELDKPQGESTKPAIFKAVMILALASLIFGSPMFFNPDGIRSEDAFRNMDWLSTRIFDAYLYKSVHEYGQFPLWCPFLGGGYPVYQHPTDASLTPAAIAVAVFGEIYGVKINLIILLFLGALGVHLICSRLLGIGFTGSIFSALVFLSAGWLPSMMLVGFYNMAFYYLIPLICYFLVRGFKEPRQLIPGAMLFAVFGYISVWGIIALALFTGLLTIFHVLSFKKKRPRLNMRPLIAYTLLGAMTLTLSAARLAEIYDLKLNGRYTHDLSSDSYESIPTWERFYQGAGHFISSALRHVPKRPQNNEEGWPISAEYAFIGIPWTAALLFFLGLIRLRRRYAPWLLSGGFVAILCFGPHFPVDLYRISIWPISFLRGMGDFFKYFNFFILLAVAPAAGAGLSYAAEKFKSPKARRNFIACAFASLIPFAAIHASLLYETFKLDAPGLPVAEEFHQVRWRTDTPETLRGVDYREYVRPDDMIAYYNLKRGIGTVDWYADIYLPENAVAKYIYDKDQSWLGNPAYLAEAWFARGENVVENFAIQGNIVKATVNVGEPDTLVINQNFNPNWESDQGAVVSYNGLLAVRLDEPDQYDVSLRFVPHRYLLNIKLTALVFLILAAAWFWMGRKARESGGMKL